MKKLILAGIIGCIALVVATEPASAQVLKGVLLTSPSHIESSYSVSTENSSESDFSSMRSFRNDTFLTVRPKVEEIKIGKSEIKVTPVFHFLSEDYDQTYDNLKKYQKESFLETYMDSFNEELVFDPFYHIGRDIDPNAFLYEEKSWDALASTLKKKYKIIRQADKLTKHVENKITLSYKSADGMAVKVRPGIDRVDGDYNAMLRCSIKRFAGIERIETRVGEDCIKLRVATFLSKKRLSKLAIELESVIEKDDDENRVRNEISQLVLEVPFW